MGRVFRFLSVIGLLSLGLIGCDESSSSVTNDQASGSGGAASASGQFEPNAAPAIVTGTVLLEGAQSHGSTLVEAVGLGATATTGSDGSFRLSVNPPGDHRRRWRSAGHEGDPLLTQNGYTTGEPKSALSQETTELDTITLSALPGSISGRLVFPTGLNAVDFQESVNWRLVPDSGDAIAGQFDENGAFGFADLKIGTYRAKYPASPLYRRYRCCWGWSGRDCAGHRPGVEDDRGGWRRPLKAWPVCRG